MFVMDILTLIKMIYVAFLVKAFITFVRPLVEYASPVWSPRDLPGTQQWWHVSANVLLNVFLAFAVIIMQKRLQLLKIDGQGKARREAARRRNSECKINLSCRNSSRGNGSRPTAQR